MSDLAVRPAAGLELTEWAAAAQQVHQIAVRLATTSFVPRSLANRPDEVTGIILAGRELGLDPMASLRSIDIIDGTPALRALTMRGLVQSHGHEVWVEDSSDTRAVVCGRRRGDTQIQKSTWTLDRAKKAGLAGKKNWVNHPAAMLIARATAEVCRLIAADVLIGMPLATEELNDELPELEPVKTTAKAAKRTVQRAPIPEAPALEAGPSVPVKKIAHYASMSREEADDRPGPEATKALAAALTGPITPGQRAALQATLRAACGDDRDERLRFVSRLLGRPVASVNDLSAADAHQVLQQIELPEPPADDWPEVGGAR